MTARERLRWAAPALLAAGMPVVSEIAVWAVAGGPLLSEPGGLAAQAVWASMPFVALAALAVFTRRAWAEVALAMGVGLALTGALWGWATWDGVRAGAGAATDGASLGIVLAGAPVILLSVMVTAAAVRAAFAPPPR